jgi:hypothetical protein
VDEVERSLRHATLLHGLVQRSDRGHGVGDDHARILHSSLHDGAPPDVKIVCTIHHPIFERSR